MNRTLMGRFSTMVFVLAGAAGFLGCDEAVETPAGPGGLLAAAGGGGKPTSGPSVTAADPGYGNQGDISKRVTITGSGFSPGAEAAWERGGVADSKVQVLSTEYVSSTQLVATITIASDAAIDLYDISVTALDRKKGIGYALFEVTQAIVVEGTELLRGANDNGDMTGRGAGGTIHWSPATGVEVLDPNPGSGWQVDQSGTHIVGNRVPRLWTRSGPTWEPLELPRDPNATGGGAFALLSDPVTGQPLLIGGQELIGGTFPRLWTWEASTSSWLRVILPTGAATDGGPVEELSGDSVAVGSVNGAAAVWQTNGSGGWTLTILGAAGSRAEGVKSDGSLIVGSIKTTGNKTAAAYWQRGSGGGWSSAIILPGGCKIARDVDVSGRIAANDCPLGNRSSPAVFVPPYSATTMIRLGGLGPTNSGQVEAMSPSGNYLVGQAKGLGVYWRIF